MVTLRKGDLQDQLEFGFVQNFYQVWNLQLGSSIFLRRFTQELTDVVKQWVTSRAGAKKYRASQRQISDFTIIFYKSSKADP